MGETFAGPYDRPMSDKEADERAFAIGTMMGEGGPNENKYGYGGILDTIENRIDAINKGANYGTKGKADVESVVTARRGAEYNAWSPVNKDAYANAQAGLTGKPSPAQQSMYDQAVKVYDDYYQGVPGIAGAAMGGTFYQNADALTPKQAASQKTMQSKYGAMPMGVAGHVVTGPGYYGPGSKTGVSAPAGFQPVSPAVTGSFAQPPEMAKVMPQSAPLPPERPIPTAPIRGSVGMNHLRGNAIDDDMLLPVNMPIDAVAKIAPKSATTTAPRAAPRAAAPAAPTPPSRESFWTPGPVATVPGSGATGQETRRTQDGVVHDVKGAYGGGEAFGPNDPFHGLGFSTKGYADVVDQFDQDMGITRTVKDKSGHVIGSMSVGGNTQNGPTGEDHSGNASVGDGSYANEAGFNDNNPQGIL